MCRKHSEHFACSEPVAKDSWRIDALTPRVFPESWVFSVADTVARALAVMALSHAEARGELPESGVEHLIKATQVRIRCSLVGWLEHLCHRVV
jgi:hypothetical protein